MFSRRFRPGDRIGRPTRVPTDSWSDDPGLARASVLALALHVVALALIAHARAPGASWVDSVSFQLDAPPPGSAERPARSALPTSGSATVEHESARWPASPSSTTQSPIRVPVEIPGPQRDDELPTVGELAANGFDVAAPRRAARRAEIRPPSEGDGVSSATLAESSIPNLVGRWTSDSWQTRRSGLSGTYATPDDDAVPVFGRHALAGGGFTGNVCSIEPGMRRLADLERCHPMGSVRFEEIGNLKRPRWAQSLPDQWVAIVITGSFSTKREGAYDFSLSSRDGSMLFIDGNLVVDNDGAHCPRVNRGSTLLRPGRHRVRLVHFQSTPQKLCPKDNSPDCATDLAFRVCYWVPHKPEPECIYPRAVCRGIQLALTVAPPAGKPQPLTEEL